MPAMQSLPRIAVLMGFVLTGLAGAARADVTIEEKSTIEAAIFKAHGNSTESYAADKKRHDTELHCEGMMSMFCGKAGSGEIVRLDKNMTYDLEPSKKRYRERPLPTEAERKEMQKRMAEALEKMKQCAAQQPQQPAAVDTSKCEMSPAKVDVKNLGPAGQILGHDVRHTAVTLTSSCTDRETHEVCDMQFGFDVWQTGDKVPGLEERDAFMKTYMQKMGLTAEGNAAMAKQVQQMLAPYAEQMKQLQAKSADLKGTSLRTSFQVSFGGPQCSKAKNSASGSAGAPPDVGTAAKDAAAQGAADVAASRAADGSVGGTIASRTLSSVGGKLLSGLFSKKKKAETADATADKAEAPADPTMVTMMKFSTETTAVTPGAVPADRFEVPADWKKVEVKPGKEEPFTCPGKGKGE